MTSQSTEAAVASPDETAIRDPRRLHRPHPSPVIRSPSCLTRRASSPEDAQNSARIQSVGDRVRLSAGRPGARARAHLHAVAGNSICRPSDRRQGRCSPDWTAAGNRRFILEEKIGPGALSRLLGRHQCQRRTRLVRDSTPAGQGSRHAENRHAHGTRRSGLKPGERRCWIDLACRALVRRQCVFLRPAQRPRRHEPLRASTCRASTSSLAAAPARRRSCSVAKHGAVGNTLHARMFAPAFGILEDPATGSAVAAFAGYLAATAVTPTASTSSASNKATRWVARA